MAWDLSAATLESRLRSGRCPMRQVRVSKECHKRDRHVWYGGLDELPLDPRDPEIVRAKQLQREQAGVRPISGPPER
jgi:hypothetical protein